MTRPRVLHMVPAAFGGKQGIVGGAERYALELARHMARLTPTRLLTFGERSERWRDGDLDVVVERAHSIRGQRSNPWALAILRWIARADVVHCHQRAILASSTAALVGRLSGRRVFVSDLGGGGFDISAFVNTAAWFSGHLHISRYSRHVNHQDEDGRAHVIMGGVDAEKFSPDAGIPPDGSVLFVGRVLPHKGINYLVEAVDESMRLKVLGVPYSPRFQADLEKLARGKRVEFVATAGEEELVRAYRQAAVAVLPSVYRNVYGDETRVPELLGQTALEAMACGVPVIVTDVASLPEVVRDGETGFVVPPNDARALREKLRWLLDHPADAARMGAAGRRRAIEHFNWPSVARHCLELYTA